MNRGPAGGRTDTASRIIQASCHALYSAWMHPHSLMAWLPPQGMRGHLEAFEAREGGRFSMTLTYRGEAHAARGKSSDHSDVVRGRFTRLVPDALIVQAIDFQSDDPAFGGTMTMTWRFEPVAAGTRVTIRCEDVPVGITAHDHEVGLHESLEQLAAFTEARR